MCASYALLSCKRSVYPSLPVATKRLQIHPATRAGTKPPKAGATTVTRASHTGLMRKWSWHAWNSAGYSPTFPSSSMSRPSMLPSSMLSTFTPAPWPRAPSSCKGPRAAPSSCRPARTQTPTCTSAIRPPPRPSGGWAQSTVLSPRHAAPTYQNQAMSIAAHKPPRAAAAPLRRPYTSSRRCNGTIPPRRCPSHVALFASRWLLLLPASRRRVRVVPAVARSLLPSAHPF